MADTPQTLADLQGLFADNTTGDISPRDLRDFLVSVLGEYALIYTPPGVDPIETSTAGAWELWDVGALTQGPMASMTTTLATNRINVTTAGTYLVWLHASYTSDDINEVLFAVALNGAELAYAVGSGIHSVVGDRHSATIITLVTCAATDYLQPFFMTAIADQITMTDGQFGAIRVG